MIGVASEEELVQIGRLKNQIDLEDASSPTNDYHLSNNDNFEILNQGGNFEVTELEEDDFNEGSSSCFFPDRENILGPKDNIKFRACSEDPEAVVFAFRCCGKPVNIMRCECIQTIFGIMLLFWMIFIIVGKLISSLTLFNPFHPIFSRFTNSLGLSF